MTNLPAIRFRGNEPDPRTMPPGTEWWTDSPHLLTARLNTAVRRGEIVRLSPLYWLNPGLRGVLVHRLKPRPPEWRKPAIVTGVAVTALTVLGVGTAVAVQLLWAVRYQIGAAVLLLLAGLFCMPGVRRHCPGCRG